MFIVGPLSLPCADTNNLAGDASSCRKNPAGVCAGDADELAGEGTVFSGETVDLAGGKNTVAGNAGTSAGDVRDDLAGDENSCTRSSPGCVPGGLKKPRNLSADVLMLSCTPLAMLMLSLRLLVWLVLPHSSQ